MGISTTHLIIFLVIIVLIFGTKKLKNIGQDLGGAVKGFKDGMREGGSAASNDAATPPPQVGTNKAAADPNTVDVEARTRS